MAMHGTFDKALTKLYRRMSAKSVQKDTWIDNNKGIVCLIVKQSDLDEIHACKGTWEMVAPQVARVVAGSDLGSALFDSAYRLVHNKSFAIFCESNN